MTDLAINPVTRKLIFVDGDLRTVTGPARVAQAVGIRLRHWQGEWFLDETRGVPYEGEILGKGKRLEMVEAVLRAQVLDVDGVELIRSFVLTLNDKTRKLTVDFEVTTRDGDATGTAILQA